MSAVDVLLVGAERWRPLIEASPRLRLAEHLRDEAALVDAQQRHPEAAAAVDLGRRGTRNAARFLAGRLAVFASPPRRGALDGTDGHAAALTWSPLPSLVQLRPRLTQALAVELDVAGPSLNAAAVEAFVLLAGFGPVPDVRHLRRQRGQLEAALGSIVLRLRVGEPRLRLAADLPDGRVEVEARAGTETLRLTLGGTRRDRTRPLPDPLRRGLAHLLKPSPNLAAVLEAVARADALVPEDLLPSAAFRQSLELRDVSPLRALGLLGDLPQGPRLPRHPVHLPPGPIELHAWRAGLKPVVFLTVRPDREAKLRSGLGEACVVRRERRVQVGAQDAWVDDRERGVARVELYVSHDAAKAERAAELQAAEDPSLHLRELGELLGYPACCVAAFADLEDRSNNSRNRYHSALRAGPGPWPWELNNLGAVLAPFYPCSFTCPDALRWVRTLLGWLDRQQPGTSDGLRAALARTMLYFDHDHAFVLGPGGVAVTTSSRPEAADLAAGLSGSATVRWTGDALVLDDRELLRTDPGLGFLAPFGPAPVG